MRELHEVCCSMILIFLKIVINTNLNYTVTIEGNCVNQV